MNIYFKTTVLHIVSSGLFVYSTMAYSQSPLSVPVPLAPPPNSQSLTEVQKRDHDPERWTQEDITLDEQFATAKKEAMAAYQIAIDECKHKQVGDTAQCLLQARHEMEADMARIKAQFGIPN